jgi:enamine deaminase RidA (YjgF/YER057c/UK114 family)
MKSMKVSPKMTNTTMTNATMTNATKQHKQLTANQVPANVPGTTEFYNSPHFSQAVLVDDKLLLSGVLGGGPQGSPELPVEEQACIALQHLVHILQAACAAADTINDLTTYPIDVNALPRFASLKTDFIVEDFPTWTANGVSALRLSAMQIEVKVTPVNGRGYAGRENGLSGD